MFHPGLGFRKTLNPGLAAGWAWSTDYSNAGWPLTSGARKAVVDEQHGPAALRGVAQYDPRIAAGNA